MEDKKLNEKESLELITNMIQNSRNRMENNCGMPFIVWGWASFFTSLLVWFAVSQTGNYNWQFLWFIIPVVGMTGTYLSTRKSPKTVTTFVDKIVNYIWIVFGIVGFLISCVAMFVWSIPILFIVVLLMGMGTTLTGMVIKYRIVIIGGALGILLSLSCLFVSGINQNIPFALTFLIMMVIPGYALNRAAHKQEKETDYSL